MEPTEEQIRQYMKDRDLNFYNAREELREQAYGGKPPGFSDWGTYWKCY